jgi:hypothetical protein
MLVTLTIGPNNVALVRDKLILLSQLCLYMEPPPYPNDTPDDVAFSLFCWTRHNQKVTLANDNTYHHGYVINYADGNWSFEK